MEGPRVLEELDKASFFSAQFRLMEPIPFINQPKTKKSNILRKHTAKNLKQIFWFFLRQASARNESEPSFEANLTTKRKPWMAR